MGTEAVDGTGYLKVLAANGAQTGHTKPLTAKRCQPLKVANSHSELQAVDGTAYLKVEAHWKHSLLIVLALVAVRGSRSLPVLSQLTTKDRRRIWKLAGARERTVGFSLLLAGIVREAALLGGGLVTVIPPPIGTGTIADHSRSNQMGSRSLKWSSHLSDSFSRCSGSQDLERSRGSLKSHDGEPWERLS